MRMIILTLVLGGCASQPAYQPWADPVAEIEFYKNFNAAYPPVPMPAQPVPAMVYNMDTGHMGLVLISPALPQ
jgi:hypothetical protein